MEDNHYRKYDSTGKAQRKSCADTDGFVEPMRPMHEQRRGQRTIGNRTSTVKKVGNMRMKAVVGLAVIALLGMGILFSACNDEGKDENAPPMAANSLENESDEQEPNHAKPTNRQIGPGELNANRPKELLSDPNLNSAATLADIYGFWEGNTKITDVIITPSAEEVYEDVQYHQQKYGVLAGQDIYDKTLEEIKQDFEELRGKIGTETNGSLHIWPDADLKSVDGHWKFENGWNTYLCESFKMPVYKDGMDEQAYEAELERLEKKEGMSFSDAWDQLFMGHKVIELQNGGWQIEHNGFSNGKRYEVYFDGIVLNNGGVPALKGRLVGTYKYPLAYMGPAQDFSELLDLGTDADPDYTYMTVTEVHEFLFETFDKADYQVTASGQNTDAQAGNAPTSGNAPAATTTSGSGIPGHVAQSPANTGTSANATQSAAGDIVGSWEAVATMFYLNEIGTPGVLEPTWEQKIISDATITHVSGDTYNLSLTTKQFLGEGDPLEDYLIRQGQLDYEAVLTGDTLTFSLESDNYALADIFDDGVFRPLTIQIPLRQEGNTMVGIVNTSQETAIRGHPTKIEVIFEMKKQN